MLFARDKSPRRRLSRPSVVLVASILLGGTLAMAPSLQSQCVRLEDQKMVPSDTAPLDHFGHSLAMDGDVLLVSSHENGHNGVGSAGTVYAFRFDGTSWLEEQILSASDPAFLDFFGISVALSGDVAIIGTPLQDDLGEDSGCVYVFRHDGSSWVEEQKFFAGDGGAGDEFGKYVAYDGNVAVIGAPGDDDAATDAGAFYVFGFDGVSWNETQKLTAADGATDDGFGDSLAVSGDVIVVGSPQDDDLGVESGSVYVFRFDGSAWSQEQKLTASNGRARDRYGSSVDVLGETVVVGAPKNDSSFNNAGLVYIYLYEGSSWLLRRALFPRNGVVGDQCGTSVSLGPDSVAVGAVGGAEGGKAFLFRRNRNGWVDDFDLEPSDGLIGDSFAENLSLKGNVLVVGAGHKDDVGHASGAAYVFNIPDIGLDADPELVSAGDVLSLHSCGGVSAGLGVLAVKEVNSSPHFYRVAIGVFDNRGGWTVSATIPPGLAGLRLGLESYGFSRNGSLVASNRVTVTCQ